MEPNIEPSPPQDPQPPSWPEVAKESTRQPTRETVTDVIDIALNDADLADIARANAADDEEKSVRQSEVDALKADLKDKKVAIDAIDQRIKERNSSVRKGTVARRGEFILENLFELNTVRYLDPKSERVVFERPMQVDERQTELALDKALASVNGGQLGLGDMVAAGEPPAADDDGTIVTDPAALLARASAAEHSRIDLGDEDLDESEADLDDEDDS